ncbi:MAG: imidazolonepropionase [Cyclobacteriaceae bacterium]|jgi:imidazolonepropionase|nr:imidazolonepropionase [Cyclobacteriaceae bacterium]
MADKKIFVNIKELFQIRPANARVIKGKEMAEFPSLANAFLLIENGIIKDFGPMQNCPELHGLEVISCSNKFVLPAFCDSHTHLVFAEPREQEFVLKIKGATYQQIAAAGGGILNSAKKLRALSETELLEKSLPRAQAIMRTGTATVEIKSGYGLTLADEIKMLRVAKRIGEETPLTVKTTFLGAHAFPAEIKREEYLKLIIEEMIPRVAEDGLADFIDVFCEAGFFSVPETISICETGLRYNLIPRLHANQLSNNGGVQAGIQVGAVSVDHLENIGDDEIQALLKSTTIPTALPLAAFYLNLPFPPARKMIEAGLPVAIASDFNPGSSPSGNMPFVISLACVKMKMTPEEAFNAATLNTAASLHLSNQTGSITAGKQADLIITKPVSSLAYLPYAISENWIDQVFVKGVSINPDH